MKQSTLSMLVFAIYMALLSIAFVLAPAPFVTFLGFATPDPLWIRIFGVVLGILAFYYAMAIREQAFRFYYWTSLGRLALLPAYVLFVLVGIAPWIALVIGAFESGCAIWTGIALRREGALTPGMPAR
ncbi:MAG: hypothetical protein K0B85_08020 [Coriobacteriia bacterium]|nr:hypothetical protein [Coriobacteriia bacterium]